MFIIQLTFKVPLVIVEKYVQSHRDFLDNYYKQGLLIISGPLKPRTGGIIIAAINDRARLEAIFAQDPYRLADIADYQFLEFVPAKHCEALNELIHKAEKL